MLKGWEPSSAVQNFLKLVPSITWKGYNVPNENIVLGKETEKQKAYFRGCWLYLQGITSTERKIKHNLKQIKENRKSTEIWRLVIVTGKTEISSSICNSKQFF